MPKWRDKAKEILQGRTIQTVRYMTNEEARSWGWSRRAVILILDNGTAIIPSADEEGNDAGVLFTTLNDTPVMPRLPLKQ